MIKRLYNSIKVKLETEPVQSSYKRCDLEKPFKKYSPVISNDKYSIFIAPSFGEQIIAANDYVIVTGNKAGGLKRIYIYPDYRNMHIRYKVDFSQKNFPGLLPNSRIVNCLVLPYFRKVDVHNTKKRSWRLVVFTDKSQIFHNFPDHADDYSGKEQSGDIKRFQESVIWDMPGNKYPAKIKECAVTEEYNPFLPDNCYEYHPKVNESMYGNSGFDKNTKVYSKDNKTVLVPRFYIPHRCIESNSFLYMGGIEIDVKMTLIGTYASNKKMGVRTGVFASSDGGRNWYLKFEFADEGTYAFQQGDSSWGENFGNRLSFNNLFEGSERCVVKKRNLSPNKMSKTLFVFSDALDAILYSDDDFIQLRTIDKHNLLTGNIVCLQGTNGTVVSHLFNNDCNNESNGNGKFYKVKVIDDYCLELYECVSSSLTNIACRHIHHINKLRDGWVVGTGEVYPNGWLMYFQMKEADNYSIYAPDRYLNYYLLNHSEASLQRTIGVDLIERKDTIWILAALDHDTLKRPNVELSHNNLIDRSSLGIYVGKLDDIDNFEKFKIVYEAHEPAFFFKKLDENYFFVGQRGEVAMSVNGVNEWKCCHINEPMIHYRGKTFQYHVIDKYLVVIK